MSLGGARIVSTVESSARGRDANTAYLYERIAEGDHDHAEQPDSLHVMRRGTSHDVAHQFLDPSHRIQDLLDYLDNRADPIFWG